VHRKSVQLFRNRVVKKKLKKLVVKHQTRKLVIKLKRKLKKTVAQKNKNLGLTFSKSFLTKKIKI
jgi:hypothetical protein